jgi:hypothetical protein
MKKLIFVGIMMIIGLVFLPVSGAQERPGLKQTVNAAQKQIAKEKENLENRVSAYWEALVAGNTKKAFDFIVPSAQTEANRTRFMNGMSNFRFENYELQEINLSGDEASVGVKRDFQIAPGIIPIEPGSLSQTLQDKWIKTEGKWYISYPKNTSPFPEAGARKQKRTIHIPQDMNTKGGEATKKD